MRIDIPRKSTPFFSEKQRLFTENQAALQKWIQAPFSKEAFENQWIEKRKSYGQVQRYLLHEGLSELYEDVIVSEKVQENLDKLKLDHCYTITTGHQLSLATGPLFFIYKILHVIKQCELLKERYPNMEFVPVYWMASEDHDFAEIQSFSIFNQLFKWDRPTEGAVGRMDLDGLEEVMSAFQGKFAHHSESEIHALIGAMTGDSYGRAFFHFVNELFGHEGLIIMDGDLPLWKKAFSPILKKELETGFSSRAVEETNVSLNEAGFPLQVEAKDTNVFYLSAKKRERIQRTENGFRIGSIDWDSTSLMNELNHAPASFSPNVVLRPVYQEFLLPNLCYVGGPGEIMYWLQLKGVFEKAQVPFPLIQARTSVLLLEEKNWQEWQRMGFHASDLWRAPQELKQEFLDREGSQAIDFSELDELTLAMTSKWQQLTHEVDSNQLGMVEAELTRIQKQLIQLKDRLEKIRKSKFDKQLKFIDAISSKCLPKGELQERSLNLFHFCADGAVFSRLDQIKQEMDPFLSDFQVILL
ncbi:MAG: bacillithiol biosynthesis cysteine-adding enzyme BshC [Flavobacteriales bacterium]